MIQATTETRCLLDELADAYALGDAPFAELLLLEMLDHGLPWDEVAAAAARGTARHFTAATPGGERV